MTSMTENEPLNTDMDANRWASEFVSLHGGDHELMRAWFANALMCGWDNHYWTTSEYKASIDCVLAALAEQPVGPTDEGIMEMMPQQMCDDLAAAARALARFHQGSDLRSRSVHRIILNRHAVDHARAVLARWGQPYKLPTTQPIPVSERLPQAKDCDAENQCWWFSTETETQWSKWTYFRGTGAESHWLSAHAIPLPIKPEAQ